MTNVVSLNSHTKGIIYGDYDLFTNSVAPTFYKIIKRRDIKSGWEMVEIVKIATKLTKDGNSTHAEPDVTNICSKPKSKCLMGMRGVQTSYITRCHPEREKRFAHIWSGKPVECSKL